MQKIEFELRDQEFITLVNLLKLKSLVSSGGEVKMLLQEGLIIYNGEVEYRKKKKLFKNDIIILNGEIEIKIV